MTVQQFDKSIFQIVNRILKINRMKMNAHFTYHVRPMWSNNLKIALSCAWFDMVECLMRLAQTLTYLTVTFWMVVFFDFGKIRSWIFTLLNYTVAVFPFIWSRFVCCKFKKENNFFLVIVCSNYQNEKSKQRNWHG